MEMIEVVLETVVWALAYMFPIAVAHECVHAIIAKRKGLYEGFGVGLATVTGLDVSPAFAVLIKEFDPLVVIAPMLVLTPIGALVTALGYWLGSFEVWLLGITILVLNTGGSAADIAMYIGSKRGKMIKQGFVGFLYWNGKWVKYKEWKKPRFPKLNLPPINPSLIRALTF